MSAQLDKLNRRMRAIPPAVRQAVAPALDQSADELVVTMRNLAPDDPATGAPDLKTSIKWREENELRRVVFTDDFKARWQEFGTTKMPANPFFWPSYRLKKKKLASRIKRAISRAVKTRRQT